MTKFLINILVISGLLTGFKSFAQSTASSPYSQYGIGLVNGSQLPESRAMGGLAAGLRKISPYSHINIANPASYSAIRITTFDAGVYGGNTNLNKGAAAENTFDAAFNHLVFAMPVTKKSALSFGLIPYSSKGYNFSSEKPVGGDTVRHIYSATGGISKVYLGYGFKLGKRLSAGANVSYLFGKLIESRAAELTDIGSLSSRIQLNNAISGINFDYGLQYEAPISKRTTLVLGYTGSSNSKLNSRGERLSTRYYSDTDADFGGLAIDTTEFISNAETKLQLPMMHTIGFAIQRTNKWMVGADINLGQWSKYREGSTNPGLQNSTGIAIGSQITPDITAVSNYFKLVDYRFGFKYDKTYINYKSQDINQMALTFGLGLPLPSNRSTFYKINLSTELGQRGKLGNNLVRERFVNVFLSFTMNDQWFQKYKFD